MFSHQKVSFCGLPPSFGRGDGGRLASLHFAKVLIARRATTFAKVDYSDYQ